MVWTVQFRPAGTQPLTAACETGKAGSEQTADVVRGSRSAWNTEKFGG